MAVNAATRTARPRGRGIDLQPGSVLEARLGAGMSLAQLSRGVVTKAALHLIERGKSRPSLKVLEAIAQRTGKPLSFFLAPHEMVRLRVVAPDSADLELAELELLYERDLYADCLRRASDLAERWRNSRPEIAARYWRARALIMTGAGNEAVDEAEWVVHKLAMTPDVVILADALDCLASAQFTAQRSEALDTARRAIDAARQVRPSDPKLLGKLFSHMATIQLDQHEWDAALQAYQEAANALDGLADMARAAQVYEGLALAYTNLGNVTEAVKYCNRAISLYSRRNELLSLANARNSLGWLLLQRGDLEAADDQLQESVRLYQSLGVRQRTALVYHSMGELRLRQGKLDEAAAAAKTSLDLAQALDEKVNSASARILQARIAELQGDAADADRNYEEAIELLSSPETTKRLIEAHSSYAELLARRGDSSGAAAHYKAALLLASPTAVDGAAGGLAVADESVQLPPWLTARLRQIAS